MPPTFVFYKRGARRDRKQIMHDMLVVASRGGKKSKIMVSCNVSWKILQDMFSEAIEAGYIEEVEKPGLRRHCYRKPVLVWKTTKKGRRYTQSIYDNYQHVSERARKGRGG